ncbi:hypothetical protein E1281_05035 [Actinomadura sp. KC345]|uniref:hypothetical protein n=1 Tax=Actinomadura sp. KC345 TaxID=2530371 RepID=UPI0010467B20|nr:hypothetical protein [Actinomadura sp. KC345]TDC57344.1 hypothetical protein E1281_05035 [Actinomadura sp. KC345]
MPFEADGALGGDGAWDGADTGEEREEAFVVLVAGARRSDGARVMSSVGPLWPSGSGRLTGSLDDLLCCLVRLESVNRDVFAEVPMPRERRVRMDDGQGGIGGVGWTVPFVCSRPEDLSKP